MNSTRSICVHNTLDSCVGASNCHKYTSHHRNAVDHADCYNLLVGKVVALMHVETHTGGYNKLCWAKQESAHQDLRFQASASLNVKTYAGWGTAKGSDEAEDVVEKWNSLSEKEGQHGESNSR